MMQVVVCTMQAHGSPLSAAPSPRPPPQEGVKRLHREARAVLRKAEMAASLAGIATALLNWLQFKVKGIGLLYCGAVQVGCELQQGPRPAAPPDAACAERAFGCSCARESYLELLPREPPSQCTQQQPPGLPPCVHRNYLVTALSPRRRRSNT